MSLQRLRAEWLLLSEVPKLFSKVLSSQVEVSGIELTGELSVKICEEISFDFLIIVPLATTPPIMIPIIIMTTEDSTREKPRALILR